MIEYFQNIFFGFTPIDLLLLAVFFALFILRVLYLFLFTGKVLFRKEEKNDVVKASPLSLIFSIRNEEENLKNNLPPLLSMDKFDFEVVAVDDFSQDSSYLVLGLLKERYKRLKISMLNQETRYSMKLSQNIALKAAENNWVIFLPISFSELSESWLSTFVNLTSIENEVVVGYSGIMPTNGFFNRLFRIENFYLQLKSTGFILNRLPFVYTEENILFQKQKYFESGGYGQHIDEPFANLELVINSFIQEGTTTVLFDQESAIRKNEDVKRKDFFELLRKSIRIEKRLTNSKRIAVAIEESSKLLFGPVAIVSILFLFELWPIIAGLLVLKLLAHSFIIKTAQNHLNERKIYVSSLVYDWLMPYFKIVFRWHFNWRCRKNKWRSKV